MHWVAGLEMSFWRILWTQKVSGDKWTTERWWNLWRYLLGFTMQTNPIWLKTSLEVNIRKARRALGRCVLCVWPNLKQLLVATGFIFFPHHFNLKQQEGKWRKKNFWPLKLWYFAPCDQSWEQHPWAQGAGKFPLCRKSQVWGAPNDTINTLWGCPASSYIFFSKSLATFCTNQSSFPSWMEPGPEHCGSFYSLNVSQQPWAASLAFWLRF